MDNEENKDAATAAGFMNIALSLRDLALKMSEKQKNEEPVDVFASFNEAMDKIKYPAEDVINADVLE